MPRTISSKLAERKRRFDEVDLYVVTCEPLSNGRSNFEVLDAVIRGGGKIIQLRDKERCRRDFFAMAQRFRAITRDAGILLIINDHVDVALAVDADGVHLGQEDLPLPAARQLAPDLLIGRSTHSLEHAKAGESEGADYINIGPIFPTSTKEHAQALGIEAISNVGPRVSIPFTVMGGITSSNIDKALEAGARKVAVVTAVTKAADMTAAVRELRERILSYE